MFLQKKIILLAKNVPLIVANVKNFLYLCSQFFDVSKTKRKNIFINRAARLIKQFIMMKKLFTFLLALTASVGMMNAKVTWNSSNVSDLSVYGTYESYSKEGVTLRANADMIDAQWYGYGDESRSGIEFHANATGGYTFSNTLGKNFTKIEMFPNGVGGWDMANLGSGWSFYWDYMNNGPVTVTWTGNAATVDLVKEASNFMGESVKSIVFYFVGDSEAPDPTYAVALKAGTANADKVKLSATSAVAGATVTVTPNEDYEITAFSAYYVVVEDQLGSIYEVDATLNTETGAYSFTMPAYDVTIEATIALKPVPEGDVFAGFTATAGSGGFDNEGHANLVDNKFTSTDWTKWCTNDGHKSVPTGESESCWWIDFEASAALNPTGYILTTGNDTGSEHGRNPKNWVLKAKLNADDAWTTIATVENDVTMKNQSFKDYKFFVDKSGSYKYFRFEVFANQGANVMQLCELRLIGSEASEPVLVTAYTLQLHVNDAAMGSVAVTNLLGSDIIDNGDGTFTVPEGAEVTLLATPNEGYEFSGWKASQTICDFAECEFVALPTVDNPLTFDMYAEAAFMAEFAAVEPEPAAEYAEIIFTEVVAAADLDADATFGLLGTDFSVTITDTDNKLSIDENHCRFGSEADFKMYDFRLKTGGKSSSKNFITLNIPAAGKIRIAVRTGSNSATDRNLVITQGEKELYNEIVQESQATKVIEGDNEVSVYPYVEVAVAAGTVLVTYPVGSLNFYSFGFMEDSTATGVDEIANGKSQTIKVIRDGQLLIIRDGKIYNVMGTVVR